MFAAFHSVQSRELLKGAFNGKEKATRAPNVIALTEQFNDVSRWVVYNVVTQMDLKKRAMLIRKFVLLAEEMRRLNNLNGVFAVVAGLSASPVHRLKKTWEVCLFVFYSFTHFHSTRSLYQLVYKDKKTHDWWEYQLELTNPQSAFGKYRAAKALCDPPCIPYLGVYLQGSMCF